jgi:hypothetical protein
MKKSIIFLIAACFALCAYGYSPDYYYASESTIREGFELQGDFSILFGEEDNAYGGILTANYRFIPRLAVGAGFGIYGSRNTWMPFFANAVWNFTETKWSPFVAVEAGVCTYSYEETYNGYYYSDDSGSEANFYLGAGGGVQYSLSEYFALKASLKINYGGDRLGAHVGLGAGVVYHFR